MVSTECPSVSSVIAVIFTLRILIPGYIILLLFGDLFDLGIEKLDGLEKIFVGFIIGFIVYLLGLGYYAKIYFPFVKNTLNILADKIKELSKNGEGKEINIDRKTVDAFHSLFWLELDVSTRDDLRFYYSFYLFDIYISTTLFIYCFVRFIYLGFLQHGNLMNYMLTDYKILSLCTIIALFLYRDAILSLKSYHNYFVRLIDKKTNVAIEIISYIKEKGTSFIATPPPFA